MDTGKEGIEQNPLTSFLLALLAWLGSIRYADVGDPVWLKAAVVASCRPLVTFSGDCQAGVEDPAWSKPLVCTPSENWERTRAIFFCALRVKWGWRKLMSYFRGTQATWLVLRLERLALFHQRGTRGSVSSASFFWGVGSRKTTWSIVWGVCCFSVLQVSLSPRFSTFLLPKA